MGLTGDGEGIGATSTGGACCGFRSDSEDFSSDLLDLLSDVSCLVSSIISERFKAIDV